MHPAVRYRHFCNNQGYLGSEDKGAYNPASLDGWTWPSAQTNGKIGAGSKNTTVGPLKYTKKNLMIPESPMGKHEKQLLALYDQDPALQAREGSIWEKVLDGQNGPPQWIKDGVARMNNPLPNPYENQSTQPSENLYIGQRPAAPWDQHFFKDYGTLGNNFRVGSWNGNGTCAQGSPAPFNSLSTITPASKIVSIRTFYDPTFKALAGFSMKHSDEVYEWYSWGQEGYEEQILNLGVDERVVKVETKASTPMTRATLIAGLKLITDKEQTWTSSGSYDQLSNDNVVAEKAPEGFFLKGFYGALGDFVDRLGPVWGK